jgi:hypothetical protein
MSYLYKKPVPKPAPAPVNEIVTPTIPEKIEIVDYPTGLNGAYCKEITYEEHLKNLELMCKADRAFMKRVREFCDDHKEEAFNVVKPLPDQESPSEHAERGE